MEDKQKDLEKDIEKDVQEMEDLGLEEIPAEIKEPEKKARGIKGFIQNRTPEFWYRVIIGGCMAVFVYAAVNLVMIFVEYGQAEATYENIEEQYVQEIVVEPEDVQGDAPEDTPGDVSEDVQGDGEDTQEEEDGGSAFQFNKLNVDFAKLQKKNRDVVGWIQFENFYLSYPIAKDNGKNYYLTHTIDKKENKSGSIYIPKQNSRDFNDTNTIIYGHNMKNGTMFGLLGRYKEKEYYELNKTFYIYTPKDERRYQIFSVYVGDANGNAYSIYGATGSEDYGKFLQDLKKKSKYDTGVNVTKDDTIVTLSTCVTNQDSKRLIIHAKRIK